MDSQVVAQAVLVGRAVPFGPRGERSGIAKEAVSGPVRVHELGLDGDEQGDLRRHGGLEKAVHLYPLEHYDAWSRCAEIPHGLCAAGGFGENIASIGVRERDVCIGDVWRLGSALVQVSQGRQPCWKLNQRFGWPQMARTVQQSGRTGWYFRVLEPGDIQAGARFVLEARPRPHLSVARVHEVLYVDCLNRAALADLVATPELTQSWRTLAARRLASGNVESWAERLGETSG